MLRRIVQTTLLTVAEGQLRFLGGSSTISFGSRATLTAACGELDSPAFQYLSVSNVTYEGPRSAPEPVVASLLNVPPLCDGIAMRTPCAHPNGAPTDARPPLYFCVWHGEGQGSEFVTGPLFASSEALPLGDAIRGPLADAANRITLACPLPPTALEAAQGAGRHQLTPA